MRKTFESQTALGLLPIEETVILKSSRHATTKISAALLELYKNVEYRNKILSILEDKICKPKHKTGRPGMNLWQIFVLGQIRLGLDLCYDQLHDLANAHDTIKSLLGVKKTGNWDMPEKEITYQNILDNVGLLTDDMVNEINDVIVEFGSKEVFKKKEEEACTLKTDSFVVKSNVHFPTDYNLLWDCMRKCVDMVEKINTNSPEIKGCRKLKNWRKRIKAASREVGQISSKGGANKAERLKEVVNNYLKITKVLTKKLQQYLPLVPLKETNLNWLYKIQLEEYIVLTIKHIDLIERRVIKGEVIPHEEKLFSIFEQYTEWINKGKPQIELGKKICITTDGNNLIIDYRIVENQADSELIADLTKTVVSKIGKKSEVSLEGLISSWSFDKGFYSKGNKVSLQEVATKVVMPKKGKLSATEKEEEGDNIFKKLRNQHSAVESNINELEHRGLNRCPDRGYSHFKRYIGLGVCAYNLHKIGAAMWNAQKAIEKAARELRVKEAA